MALEVMQFPCLQDNYGYLIHDAASGQTAVVDTPEAGAINQALNSRGWSLTHILNTHHHFDHAGGNEALKAQWHCKVIGADNDAARIPGIDMRVRDGETFDFAGHAVRVLEVPGHTTGHIAYYIPDEGIAFVGDTVFALGCGRLFEGTPAQMWDSIQKIMALPDNTVLYCAHEYTQSNARFALSVDPDNAQLRTRVAEIDALRAQNKPTVPSLLSVEKATNPFLRAEDPGLQANLGLTGADAVAVFAETRRRKDNF